MLSLYEILKASKTGIAPDMWTALAGKNWGGKDSGAEVKELTGIPPLSFTTNGTPLLDYLISGNMTQTATPTPTTPIQPQETGDRTGNLFDKDNYVLSHYYGASENVIFTDVNNVRSFIFRCKPNTTYQIAKILSNRFAIWSLTNYPTNGIAINAKVADGTATHLEFTTGSNDNYLLIMFSYASDAPSTQDIANSVMINTGSTALPYENFGYKIPITVKDFSCTILGVQQSTNYAYISKSDLPNASVGDYISTTIEGVDYSLAIMQIDDNYIYIENRTV